MPDQTTLTIRIEDRIRVRDDSGSEGPFAFDPGDIVGWTGDSSVAQWVVGFTEPGKVPFTGNQRIFWGVGAASMRGKTRHAPDDYCFWVFAERPSGGGSALFLDPRLVIRARTSGFTRTGLQALVDAADMTITNATTLIESADAIRLEALALMREMDPGGTSSGEGY